jgi:hypothetical protein
MIECALNKMMMHRYEEDWLVPSSQLQQNIVNVPGSDFEASKQTMILQMILHLRKFMTTNVDLTIARSQVSAFDFRLNMGPLFGMKRTNSEVNTGSRFTRRVHSNSNNNLTPSANIFFSTYQPQFTNLRSMTVNDKHAFTQESKK